LTSVSRFQSNPFVRRKCNPRIVTKTKEDLMNEEQLMQMAAFDDNDKKKEVLTVHTCINLHCVHYCKSIKA
jgi:hypothetical protein